jgi:beta-galactosidase
MDDYDLLYMPYPVMLTSETAARLVKWVEHGGSLISEGCPAYFGDRAHVGERQPNLGLDALFGAMESGVLFTPDLLNDLTLTVGGRFARGGLFRQQYTPTTGQAVGAYDDGSVAAVQHAIGRGRTLLVGTFPGYGHWQHTADEGCREFFAWLLDWAGHIPHVRVTDTRITARLQATEGRLYLWLTNPTRSALPVHVDVSSRWGRIVDARVRLGKPVEPPVVGSDDLNLTMPARDGVVLELIQVGWRARRWHLGDRQA